MRTLDTLVLTPPGLSDPSLAIAACRAGSRGVLDLELVSESQTALASIARLARFANGHFGIKLGRDSRAIVELLATDPPSGLGSVLLAGGYHRDLRAWIEAFRNKQIDVLFEVVDMAEATLAESLGITGLVLKGQEAGGRVGRETAFILLQRWFAGHSGLPVWVQGGVGLNTAAACLAAGATGVVLDSQLLLARESPLDEATRQQLRAFDGSETICLGERLGQAQRFYYRPGLAGIEELSREEERIFNSSMSQEEKVEAWRQTVGILQRDYSLWPLGQDACFAKPFVDRFVTVSGIIQAIKDRAGRYLDAARRCQPLAPGSLLAERHKTRYPIVQGPMTRVSDTAQFAEAVAGAGGLPFLALALLRRAETEKLLSETRALAAGKSWGVGILGFVPSEIRQEQIEAIRACPPPFALIAGGRPDQARELEKQGVVTYLHVPSPGLLRLFLKDGARRFVFEGRECGGHVGPRTSFVLWETMCEILLEHLGPSGRGDDLNVVFAGGIHDARSAAMVAALAAGLAERGVAVGVLMGTAYLFTHEAVAAGAIVPRFQKLAVGCQETVLLQTGPGHAIRCVKTPYYDVFEQEKSRLQKEGKSHEEIVKALEWMNIGRLRVASKGIEREREGTGLVSLPDEMQVERGMYMIGQLACLRDQVASMADLHQDVSIGSGHFLGDSVPLEIVDTDVRQEPCDIAIVGMACFYPKASGLIAYWENILNKVNAVGEIPPTHWDWRLYYDPDPRAPDKIISKWGGFLDDIPFDPIPYGITPNSLHSIEPLQLFLLESVRLALADAGYAERPFNRDRTCAILGIGGGGSPVAVAYGFRTCIPLLERVPNLEINAAEVLKKADSMLPTWTEDTFPGILFNVAVGRVANRFNFGGANYAIDAACGSSLAAVQACVRELETGTSDVAVAMGADTVQTPYAYMAFSKTHALSPRGQCRPFDETADGIVLSEGTAAVILKRLADAERDGDRIYAVLRGMGASSDGRGKGLTAPRAEGQLRAVRRAFAQAGISPGRIALVEAHGTGTVVGDQTEAEALEQVFREAGALPQSCAVGSVKSMIGHSKCAAGIAGLIKTSLALYHKVLPPTLVEKPNPESTFSNGPLFLNTEARPWVHGGGRPRCAGVSAFGFGGTNFHVVLEEYSNGYLAGPTPAIKHWPAELLVWRRPSAEALAEAVHQCQQALVEGANPDLADLAFSLCKANKPGHGQPILAIIATSRDDLKDKLGIALASLRSSKERLHDPRGIYYATNPAANAGKVAFLFPGQGSQYPNMLAQLAMNFAELRQAFDHAEESLAEHLEKPLGRYIFPPSTFTPQQEHEAIQSLTRTEIAQPALGAAGMGMFHLLTRFGLEPDFLAGHSYGEYVALCAAGALAESDLARLSHLRGTVIVEATKETPGSMVAFDAGSAMVEEIVAGLDGVTLANSNAPRQTVVSGTEAALELALGRAKEKGIRGNRIAVSRGFHSPLVAKAREPFAQILAKFSFALPQKPVFSNTTAKRYPAEAAAIPALLAEHLEKPVLFQAEILAMYEAGARIFVEVGPQAVLTGLVGQILADKPHVAVASEVKGRAGLVQLQHLLGTLLVQGLPLCLEPLYQGRDLRQFDVADLKHVTIKPKPPSSTWIINSVRNRPVNAPEPQLLGQPRPAPAPIAASAKPIGVARAESSKGVLSPTPFEDSGRATGLQNGAPPLPLQSETAATDDEATAVMLRFQDLMARFLDTQKSVMTSYLQGTGNTVAPLPLPSWPSLPVANSSEREKVSVSKPSPTTPTPTAQAATANSSNGSAAPEKNAPGLDRAWLLNHLLELISQRTGYPKDMLGVDQDLEADLGIDSIKRVEILGGLAEAMMGKDSSTVSNLEMENLTGLKSLRSILDYLDRAVQGNGELQQVNGQTKKENKSLEVQRALVRLVEAPLPTRPALMFPQGTILFTDDGEGIAREMAGRLAELGQKSVLLRHGSVTNTASADVLQADLTDPKVVENLLTKLQESGAIGGLIHLLPLGRPPAGEQSMERMRREVKSLYLLTRGLGDSLRQAGSRGGAVLLAATSLGGNLGFGKEPLTDAYFSGHGGIVGFVKCLALEFPEVLVRVVDVDRSKGVVQLAERLLEELGNADSPVEVGYAGHKRVTWEPFAAPLPKDTAMSPILNEKSTVLITGGARGITAAVALELCKRFQPNVVIVGRSALPDQAESAETASLTKAAEIKAALIARMQREGRTVAAAAVEATYRRLMQDREIRSNLSQFKRAGGKVQYCQVDVCDEQAMARLLADIDQRYGGLDGVIHGAGIIEDKLVKDKTPESFDRVFDTKAASAIILSRHLQPRRLKFCVFFTSIASRYGNKGQSDYAAANETLSKLALELDRRWPCRVLSVAWGPWSGVGMVAELEEHLARRGLRLISPEVGPVFMIDELTYGQKGETEVIIAGGAEETVRPARPAKKEVVGAGTGEGRTA